MLRVHAVAEQTHTGWQSVNAAPTDVRPTMMAPLARLRSRFGNDSRPNIASRKDAAEEPATAVRRVAAIAPVVRRATVPRGTGDDESDIDPAPAHPGQHVAVKSISSLRIPTSALRPSRRDRDDASASGTRRGHGQRRRAATNYGDGRPNELAFLRSSSDRFKKSRRRHSPFEKSRSSALFCEHPISSSSPPRRNPTG